MYPSEFQTNPDVVELALNWNLQRALVWKNNQLCKGSEEPSPLCPWINVCARLRDIHISCGERTLTLSHFYKYSLLVLP